MSDQIQFRGGTTSQHSSFIGAPRELTVDTTKKTLVVHDGATAGGNPVMRENMSNALVGADVNFNNFSTIGLRAAVAAGETVRFNQLQKGSDIAVAASGTVAIPAEGSLFNLTSASAFNVTGFTGGYDGRTFNVRFNPDKLLTLVNSSTFKLLGGTNRITMSGEIISFTQESSGVIAQVGLQPMLDLSSYAGADIQLGIGQSAIYNVSAITSLLLRIATGDNQKYRIYADINYVAPSALAAAGLLNPNNATPGVNQILLQSVYANAGTMVPSQSNQSSFVTYIGGQLYDLDILISTKTVSKKVISKWYCGSAVGQSSAGTYNNIWTDTSTAWTSLGTMTFDKSTTGLIYVQRVG